MNAQLPLDTETSEKAEPKTVDQKVIKSSKVPVPVQPGDDFDWAHDDSVVLRHQPGVAVYINQRDDLVIRQEGQYHPDEDVFIYISPNNIQDFIDKLTDICGIPSVGKP
jgi:hypothetical protein